MRTSWSNLSLPSQKNVRLNLKIGSVGPIAIENKLLSDSRVFKNCELLFINDHWCNNLLNERIRNVNANIYFASYTLSKMGLFRLMLVALPWNIIALMIRSLIKCILKNEPYYQSHRWFSIATETAICAKQNQNLKILINQNILAHAMCLIQEHYH